MVSLIFEGPTVPICTRPFATSRFAPGKWGLSDCTRLWLPEHWMGQMPTLGRPDIHNFIAL